MKKITLLLLVVIFAVGSVFAQTAKKKWAIGAGAGMSFNEDNAFAVEGVDSEKNSLLEFYISRYLNPSFDIMLDLRISYYGDQAFGKDWGESGESFFGDGVDITNPLLNLRYKLSNGYILKENSMFQPYVFGGAGFIWDNDENGLNFDAGVGVKVPVSKSLALGLNGAYIKNIEEVTGAEIIDDHWQITGFVDFALGKNDADGDGVRDGKDECPDTPAGVTVDEKGCPVDSDGDGVPDYKDDCPNEAGSAQLNGCPDTDGDGIADKDDDCPEEAGLAKFNGCPDTDEDGVQDSKDKCPDTPKGCPVDVDGCPLDSDGDGVIDCEDKCPTEKGPASNNGCPDWVEISVSELYFDFDKSELKPDGMAELDKLVEKLNASKEFEIVVGGHTDNVGTEGYNMELSEERAQAVVKYLLKKGVNNAYIGSNNYGETKPAVENSTEENRQQNRRAEFEVAKMRK